MSDNQTNYINAFVDVTVGTLHETLGKNLHLQTQLKISETVIAALNKKIEDIQNTYNDANGKTQFEANQKINAKEQELQALQTKVNNLDGLLNQVRDMKRIILEKEAEIANLKNKKTKKKTKTAPVEASKDEPQFTNGAVALVEDHSNEF